MKKVFLTLFAAAVSVAAMAQTDFWAWHNGTATKMVAADSITFTEPEFSYEAVDLGLSVKWATFNVGATKPEEYGDYFAWGETSPHETETYDMDSYALTSDGYTFITCTDENGNLTSEYDAATVNWGGAWRMPTKIELQELMNTDNCTWTWYAAGNTKYSGVAGIEVTSKKNGYTDKSIFLPAAGFQGDSELIDAGTYVNIWSASLSTYNVQCATCMYSSSSVEPGLNNFSTRYSGIPVRPVCK